MGGNVTIDNREADRIDVVKFGRTRVANAIETRLESISSHFFKEYGIPLWNLEAYELKDFLSGSTVHLFAADIPDENFIKVKPVLGDIDTQVDYNLKTQLKSFLDNLKLTDNRFLGYKQSGDQYLSLWRVTELGINVQIDFELTEFQNGRPTAWSHFSHSSSWNDLELGIKGAFHKLLLRALTARKIVSGVLMPKNPKGKVKVITKGLMAFSLKGLRVRYVPVDTEEAAVYPMPVYTERPSAGAKYLTDLKALFTAFFGYEGTQTELEQMNSFIGLIDLMKQSFSIDDQITILKSFIAIVWEKGNAAEDYNTKMKAVSYMMETLGLDSNSLHAL